MPTIKKSIWIVESDGNVENYLSGTIIDELYRGLKKNVCDEVVRINQNEFLESYIDTLNRKLLTVPKVQLLPLPTPVAVPQTNSRPNSSKSALNGNSRPTSGVLHLPKTQQENEKILIVIDIQCSDAIEAITHILQRKSSVSSSIVKIIALSSILSWGGRRYPKGPIDGDAEFRNRVPLASATIAYSNENSLQRLNNNIFLKNGSGSVLILGIGLLYGKDGLDLKEILKALWDACEEESFSPLQLFRDSYRGRSPLCHLNNLTAIVNSLATKALRGETFPSPFVCAADGGASEPFHELLVKMHSQLNGAFLALQLSNIPRATPSTSNIQATSVRKDLWKCDLSFQQSGASSGESKSLLNGLDELWEDFTRENNLSPVRILIAGSPKSGKTECSKLVAERLRIPVVDVVGAVRFAFSADSAALPLPRWMDRSALATIRTEICHLLDARLAAENAKQKKDKNTLADKVDRVYELSELTDSFCNTLQPELTLKCLAAQLFASPVSVRRGFVLDIWQTELLAGGRTAAVKLVEALSTEPSNRQNDDSAIRKAFDIIVEIQTSEKVVVDRLLQSLGPAAAKAKDGQAAIKALEGLLAAYSAQMDPTQGSHKAVLELEQAHSASALRLDTALLEAGIEPMASAVCQHALALRGGSIGWLPDLSLLPSVPPSDAAASSSSSAEVVEQIRTSSQHDKGREPEESSSAESASLSEEDKKKLAVNAEKLQKFLTATVLPYVSGGMVKVMRERPADPVRFLSRYLLQQSEALRTQSEEAARRNFFDLMHSQPRAGTSNTDATQTGRTTAED